MLKRGEVRKPVQGKAVKQFRLEHHAADPRFHIAKVVLVAFNPFDGSDLFLLLWVVRLP